MPGKAAEVLVTDSLLTILRQIVRESTVSRRLAQRAQVILLANFFISIFAGRKCGRNPWKANGLEWSAPSPPPHGNFETVPVVYRGPYEYSSPLSDEDYLPQTEPPPKAPIPVPEPEAEPDPVTAKEQETQ